MGNPNQQEVMDAILTAVNVGNGKAAEEAVKKINEDFILIRKSDLPPVEIKPVYRPNRGDYMDRPVARTASLYGKAPASYYWKRAHDIVAIALYAEQEEAKQAERELAGMREEAWRMLHPYEAKWDYETQTLSSQKQVDVVVNLMRQVDELKASK